MSHLSLRGREAPEAISKQRNEMGVFQMSWVGALSIARGMETAPTSNRNETHPNEIALPPEPALSRTKGRLAMTGKVARCGSLLKHGIVKVVTVRDLEIAAAKRELLPLC